MSLPAQVLEPQTRSVGMGLFFSIYYLVNMTAPWLIGTIAEAAGSPGVALDLGALCLCLGLLVWIAFRQLASKSCSPACP